MKKVENKTICATTVKRIASMLDTIIWADKSQSLPVLEKLAAHNIGTNVKCLVSMLSASNDDATVKASFALEGMIMEAGNPDGNISSEKLGKALADALSYAKDDSATCIVLEAIRRLAAGDVLEQVAPYLMADDPVFTYATMCVEALVAWIEPADIIETLISAADATKNKDKKKRLFGAALHISRLLYEDELNDVWGEDSEQFETGKLTADNQTAIMMLEELSNIPLFLDAKRVDKALDSPSKIVRGAVQRAIFRAVTSGYDFTDSIIMLWNSCEKRLSASLLKSLFAIYLTDECCLGSASLKVLKRAIQNGDAILFETALKLLSKLSSDKASVEYALNLTVNIPDKMSVHKVALLNFFGKMKNEMAVPYVMSQLKSRKSDIRDAAEAAARELGVNPQLIEKMLPPAK